jgi:Ca2+-binding EF-hand superfamily protein
MKLMRMDPMEVMHMIDKGTKGYVTREEFLKFQEQFFNRMDRDHNGRISEVEWTDAG